MKKLYPFLLKNLSFTLVALSVTVLNAQANSHMDEEVEHASRLQSNPSFTVQGRFSGNSSVINAGGTSFLQGMMAVTVNPRPNGDLNLRQAASFEITSPALNGCEIDLVATTSQNARQLLLQLNGQGAACQAFLNQALTQGVTIRFRNVPILNGGTADSVTVQIMGR